MVNFVRLLMFTQSSVADVSYPEMSFKNDTIIRNIFSQISWNAKQNKREGKRHSTANDGIVFYIKNPIFSHSLKEIMEDAIKRI